jgi:hypothetical protein
MFMLRCGTPPFVANKLIVLYNKIQKDPVVFTTDCAAGFRTLILKMMEKDPTKRSSLDGVIRDAWLKVKPVAVGGKPQASSEKVSARACFIILPIGANHGAAQDDASWKAAINGSAEKIKITSEDMMQSVHLAKGHVDDKKDEGVVDPPPVDKRLSGIGEEKSGKQNMSDVELERRVKSFKKKASIRQRSFETLDHLMEEKPGQPRPPDKKPAAGGGGGDSDEDDMFDFGDDDDDNVGRVSRLDSVQFNSVMDTLAHQTPPPNKKKQAPIPAGALTVGRVLDGLPNPQIGIRAAYDSDKGTRQNQEDTVTVIMDLSSLGDVLPRPYLYQK